MSDIDVLIKAYYSKQSMSQETLTAIKSLTPRKPTSQERCTSEQAKPVFRPALNIWKYSAVALLLMTLGMSSVMVYEQQVRLDKQKILEEFASSHRQPFSTENKIVSTNFSELSTELMKANFVINIPEKIRNGFTLLAGHYCSISNQLTVHLQLRRNKDKKISSLFITSTSPLLRKIESNTPWTMKENDMYWSDHSTFYALLNPN